MRASLMITSTAKRIPSIAQNSNKNHDQGKWGKLNLIYRELNQKMIQLKDEERISLLTPSAYLMDGCIFRFMDI